MLTGSFGTRAVEAWARLRREGAEPSRVDVIKARKERKIVCRLAGSGPNDTVAIAKRCRLETGLLERRIYDEMLPRLGVPALRCLGVVEEDDARHCWLFLEHADGGRYDASIGEHRRLAGRWLGLLHSAVPAGATSMLPDRSVGYHQQHLRDALANIAASRVNRALSPAHRWVLDAACVELTRLHDRWAELERGCEAMPLTVVHGDFVPKNLRVRQDAAGAALLCFDWGCAGRGAPAVDLAQAPPSSPRFAASPDLGSYWRVVRDAWPECDWATVRRWAAIGNVFRALAALAWASRSLGSGWVDEPVARMRVALAAIAELQSMEGRHEH